MGHAIEAATGYARYRHGEAVELGLLAALRLSGSGRSARRGAPNCCTLAVCRSELQGRDPEAVVMATARDKKRMGEGPVPFVLLPEPATRARAARTHRELIAAVRELAAASS